MGFWAVSLPPTEAASIAVGYALFVGVFIYRKISMDDMVKMLIRTARVTGVIFVIIAFASIVAGISALIRFRNWSRIPFLGYRTIVMW